MAGQPRQRDIDPPDLPRELGTAEPALRSGAAFDGVRAGQDLAVAEEVFDAVLSEAVFADVDFRGRRLLGLRATDVRFESCDLAGAVLDRARMTRVEFVGCRMTGTVFSGGQLQDVLIDSCIADLSTFRMVKAAYLTIRGTSLREADLYQAGLETSRIIDCDLAGADVSEATVPGLDLRGSRLAGLIRPSGLRGARVTSDQLIDLAAALAVEFGIEVAD